MEQIPHNDENKKKLENTEISDLRLKMEGDAGYVRENLDKTVTKLDLLSNKIEDLKNYLLKMKEHKDWLNENRKSIDSSQDYISDEDIHNTQEEIRLLEDLMATVQEELSHITLGEAFISANQSLLDEANDMFKEDLLNRDQENLQ